MSSHSDIILLAQQTVSKALGQHTISTAQQTIWMCKCMHDSRFRVPESESKMHCLLRALPFLPHGLSQHVTACQAVLLACSYGAQEEPVPAGTYIGPETNCTAFAGDMPGLANGLVYDFNNSGQTFRSMHLSLPAHHASCTALHCSTCPSIASHACSAHWSKCRQQL